MVLPAAPVGAGAPICIQVRLDAQNVCTRQPDLCGGESCGNNCVFARTLHGIGANLVLETAKVVSGSSSHLLLPENPGAICTEWDCFQGLRTFRAYIFYLAYI
jgi:hypothetical protein